jgi:hypothetical protein
VTGLHCVNYQACIIAAVHSGKKLGTLPGYLRSNPTRFVLSDCWHGLRNSASVRGSAFRDTSQSLRHSVETHATHCTAAGNPETTHQGQGPRWFAEQQTHWLQQVLLCRWNKAPCTRTGSCTLPPWSRGPVLGQTLGPACSLPDAAPRDTRSRSEPGVLPLNALSPAALS